MSENPVIRWGTLDWREPEKKALIDLLSQDDPILTMGKKVREFELKFARWLGAKYCVMTNSGTSALMVALRAYCMPKSHVYTTSLTYPAVWNAIQVTDNFIACSDVGSQFVMYIPEKEYCLAVHLLGKPCKGIEGKPYFIEDASEALGSTYKGKKLGTFGKMGCFSFYVQHQLTTVEGGAVVINEADDSEARATYERCLALRDNGRICSCPVCTLKSAGVCAKRINFHGLERRWASVMNGYNFKPTEIQAVIGLEKLKRLDQSNQRRHDIFKYYEQEFHTLVEEKDEYIVPLAYPVKVKNPSRMINILAKKGIETRGMFPCFAESYKNAKLLSETHILLPLHQSLTDENVEYIIKKVKDANE
jgi:CDP-6-deoxy-D-xylo-4-hexulose-3-dehydrase